VPFAEAVAVSESAVFGQTAVVGIGATEFSRASGRSELSLATEAIAAALDDAGIDRRQVSGLVTYVSDTNPEVSITRSLGIEELKFFSRVSYSGGAAGAVILQAALAVSAGIADVVVCYRAINVRSGRRFGAGKVTPPTIPTTESEERGWTLPYGLQTPAGWFAMMARRYMHEFGATSEDFGRVTVSARRFAATNPKAYFYGKPATLEDHQASRWIVDPLRLLDCCLETDGAVAVVVTSLDRAQSCRSQPAVIRAAAQGIAKDQTNLRSYYREARDFVTLPELSLVARQLWNQAGIGPKEIDAGIFYDHFTPAVLMQIEALGFCAVGEGKDFVAEGNIDIGGRLPVNMNGGQIGEGYVHGMNGLAEAVRQVRGTAVNQVPGLENVLVTGGQAVPTSAVVLGRA
jgi:acetyl-CoA acetyltransferase